MMPEMNLRTAWSRTESSSTIGQALAQRVPCRNRAMRAALWDPLPGTLLREAMIKYGRGRRDSG